MTPISKSLSAIKYESLTIIYSKVSKGATMVLSVYRKPKVHGYICIVFKFKSNRPTIFLKFNFMSQK